MAGCVESTAQPAVPRALTGPLPERAPRVPSPPHVHSTHFCHKRIDNGIVECSSGNAPNYVRVVSEPAGATGGKQMQPATYLNLELLDGVYVCIRVYSPQERSQTHMQRNFKCSRVNYTYYYTYRVKDT